ncbi:hypothetical protein C5167_020220 [Papaver somniferum]|uniref:Uncharacterized protein n=1 Tax=Papaver somniferum TaxID=3469 RepID=A0A4Y7IUI1_PAPSO|nr:hypothetical protein C5167_020220 [Papaver somniferum]
MLQEIITMFANITMKYVKNPVRRFRVEEYDTNKGAKRMVTEWPDLDLEARRFTARITGEEINDAKRL